MKKIAIAITAALVLAGPAQAECVSQSLLTWVDNREANAISPARWQAVRNSLLERDGGMPLADMQVIYNRRVWNGWVADHWVPIIGAMNCLKSQAEADAAAAAAQAEADAAAAAAAQAEAEAAQAEAEAAAADAKKAKEEAEAKAQAEAEPAPAQAEVEPAQEEVGSNDTFIIAHVNSVDIEKPYRHEKDTFRYEYDYALYAAKWNGIVLAPGGFVRLIKNDSASVLDKWFQKYQIYEPSGFKRETSYLPEQIEAQDQWLAWYNSEALPRGWDDWGKWGPWADLSVYDKSWMEGTLQQTDNTWHLKLQNAFGPGYSEQSAPPVGNPNILGGKAHWSGQFERYQVHPDSIAAGYAQERVSDGNGGFENQAAAPTMVFETTFGADRNPGQFNAFIDWPIAAASRTGYLKGWTPTGAGSADTLTTSWHHDGERWWKTTYSSTNCRCDTWRGISFSDGTFDDGELSAKFYKTDANSVAEFRRDNSAIAGHVRRAKIIGEFTTGEGKAGSYQ